MWNGAWGPEYVVCDSAFLASIRCNLVVVGLVDGICDQRPSCALRCPLLFLTFPLAVPLFLADQNALLAALLPHSTINPHQIAGIFSWTVKSAVNHEDGKL